MFNDRHIQACAIDNISVAAVVVSAISVSSAPLVHMPSPKTQNPLQSIFLRRLLAIAALSGSDFLDWIKKIWS